jgi:hypothetical protein
MDMFEPESSAAWGTLDNLGYFDHRDAVGNGGPISFARKEMLGTYIESCSPRIGSLREPVERVSVKYRLSYSLV